jgi:hypothetical protein
MLYQIDCELWGAHRNVSQVLVLRTSSILLLLLVATALAVRGRR